MNQVIEPYTTADRKEAVAIWNAVVEDGMAFPKRTFSQKKQEKPSFKANPLPALPKTLQQERLWAYTFSIPIMLGGAVISATQATP